MTPTEDCKLKRAAVRWSRAAYAASFARFLVITKGALEVLEVFKVLYSFLKLPTRRFNIMQHITNSAICSL